MKNLLGKSRTKETPYAIFRGYGPFGNTEVLLLKTYKKPKTELVDPYSRWFVAVLSDYTYGSYDLGDSYVKDVVRGLNLTYASDEFKENYFDMVVELVEVTGMVKQG